MISKDLSPDDKARLDELNDAVTGAIAARTKWLDSKMEEYAGIQIGEEIYDLDLLMPIGIVIRHYRLQAGRNDLHDTSLYIHYEYSPHGGSHMIYNTSGQPGLYFGTKDQAASIARGHVAALEAEAKP